MKLCTRITILFLYFLLCLPVLASETETLHVLLQGSSAADMTSLVEEAGGTVTHDLHIINAIGAKLQRHQLAHVLKSPLVTRHIDDLSDTKRPVKAPEKEDCKVRGHIELTFLPQGILWPLYNKRSTPAVMEELELAWPPAMGRVTAITVGDNTISSELYRASPTGSLKIKFPASGGPIVKERTDLKINFQSPTPDMTDSPPRQSDFTLKATFAGGCSDKLVPGYVNNHENFYYTSVAGVDALQRQGVTGKGVTVAVVDSGLWENDALLKDTTGRVRVVAKYDALADVVGKEVVDESGHGTHISSIIVNSSQTKDNGRPTGSYKGVAPDANLVAVKVLDREGLAHVLEIVRAIQWVVDHRKEYNIRVLNLSFAQTPRWPYWDDPVNQAVMRAWADGIAVVAAAGNEGPDAGTIGSPGNLPYIITVGAITDSWTPDTRDDDYLPDFSSRGPTPEGHVKPDVVALGGHMTGLIRPDSALAFEQPEDLLKSGEFVSTGSSQASAVVAGMLALLLQLEPSLTPDELKCKLTSSAEPAINRDGKLTYSPFEQGYGLVSVSRAVTLGQTACANLDLDIEADIHNQGRFYGPAIVAEDGSATLPGFRNIVSVEPSENGLSESRKWGVKDHIEREGYSAPDLNPSELGQFNWQELYLHERTIIEGLSRGTPAEP